MSRSVRFALALTTGALLGVAYGALIATDRWVEVGWASVLTTATVASVRLLPPEARRTLAALALFTLALRMGSAVLIHLGSRALGMDGFVSGDDRDYFTLADGFVAVMNGEVRDGIVPPHWGGKVYLFGTWVYVESALVQALGPRPLVPILLNAALGAVTVLLAYALARRWWGHRSGLLTAAVLSVHPTIVLWSALNLKDALALFLIMLVFWSLVRYGSQPTVFPLLPILLSMWAMQSLRLYVFVGLAVVVPIAVALARHPDLRARLRWSAAAAVVSGLLLVTQQTGLAATPYLVGEAEYVRRGLAAGARTSFQDPAPVRVSDGTTFVVAGSPAATPRVVHVPANARIVLRTPPPTTTGSNAPPDAEPPGGTVVVDPGDIVVVGDANMTPAPETERVQLDLQSGKAVRLSSDSETLVLRTLGYLPKGLLYTIAAPWPWLSDRTIDLLLIPEMLSWYGFVVLFWATLWRRRDRAAELLPAALFVVGITMVLALLEGSWATLLRHRSMVIPLTVAVAAGTSLDVIRRLPALVARLRHTRSEGTIGPAARTS